MATHTEPLWADTRRRQAGPAAHARTQPVGPYRPSRLDLTPVGFDPLVGQTLHNRLPLESYAHLSSPVAESRMKNRPASAKAGAFLETSLGPKLSFDVANASKWSSLISRQLDSQLLESKHAIGHQALATRFVDRGRRAIDHQDGVVAACQFDRGRQPGGSAADYQYIDLGRWLH